jgi:hypothetical protein
MLLRSIPTLLVLTLVACSEEAAKAGSSSSSQCPPDSPGGTGVPSASSGSTDESSSSSGAPELPEDELGDGMRPQSSAPCTTATGGGGAGASPDAGGGGVTTKRSRGEPCDTDAECADGKCVQYTASRGSGSFCTNVCSSASDCPRGWACSLVTFRACVPD